MAAMDLLLNQDGGDSANRDEMAGRAAGGQQLGGIEEKLQPMTYILNVQLMLKMMRLAGKRMMTPLMATLTDAKMME